jgi:endonuclease/exonuclease/phosphatase family metal-dependent hydrolase
VSEPTIPAARPTGTVARLAAAVLLALLVLTALPAPHASAALAAPSGLKATSVAPTSVALSWQALAKAPRYRLQYSTSSAMTSPVYQRSYGTTATVASLTASTTYYVKIRAITDSGASLSPYSKAVTVRTAAQPATPAAPAGLRASGVTQTSMTLSWQAAPAAPRYRIQYSTSASMADAVYQRSYETTTTTGSLTPDTTYYVRVRTITDSGTNLSPYSSAISLRTAAKPVIAPVPAASSAPLRVGSYNIKCANCAGTAANELPWSGRRDAVAAAIKAQHLDVIGIQEASQGWLKDASGQSIDLSQFEDLANRLGGTWTLANNQRNNCVKSTTPSNCEYKDQGASQGTRILYDAASVEMVSSGSKLLPSQDSTGNARYLAWAVLKQRSTGLEFFFADSHLEPGADKYAMRQEQAKAAVATIKARNTGNLPVIAVGDFNSSRFADPTNAPYDAYIQAGFVDPLGGAYNSTKAVNAPVEHRINTWLNSFNDFVRVAKGNRSWDNGSYIDYMLTTPMRISEWETVANLDSNGNFVGTIPSDHNMVRMTVYLPTR